MSYLTDYQLLMAALASGLLLGCALRLVMAVLPTRGRR